MRVAFVSSETTRRRDSADARRIERVAGLLAARGHDVTVFCAQWWNDYTAERTVDGVRYCGLTVGTATAAFVSRLPVALARYRPAVVHARLTPPHTALAARAGATVARAPLVVEHSGEQSIDGQRGTAAVAAADRIVVPSELVQTAVRQQGANKATTRTIPESIDYQQIAATDPAAGVDIVYAHSLDETANLEALLLALAELRSREWTATIVGDGPRREEYERQVEALRIADRVAFAGWPDRDRRRALYRGAHVFVQTATRVQFPLELLRGLAAGTVGIVEYHSGSSAHELIEKYDRSYRVTDTETMADAITAAGGLEHRTVDQRWQTYSHERVLEQYLSLYDELTDSEPNAASRPPRSAGAEAGR
jgi:Glycosyltransferase